MDKVLLLLGVSFLIIGSVLFIGAYFVSNLYSISGFHKFHGLGETWRFPSTPLSLNDGDLGTNIGRYVGDWFARFYIVTTNGTRVLLHGARAPSGFEGVWQMPIQDVPASDFSGFLIEVESWWGGEQATGSASLTITILGQAPNRLFQLIGIIVLLAGAVMIPVAFLDKHVEQMKIKTVIGSILRIDSALLIAIGLFFLIISIVGNALYMPEIIGARDPELYGIYMLPFEIFEILGGILFVVSHLLLKERKKLQETNWRGDEPKKGGFSYLNP